MAADGVDERTVYLARLIIDLDLPPEPIVERLSLAGRETRTFDQGVDVLETLAKARFPGAADALIEYTPAPVEPSSPPFHWECPGLPYRDPPSTALLSLLADPDTPGSLFRALEKLGSRTVHLARGWVSSCPTCWRTANPTPGYGCAPCAEVRQAAATRLSLR